MYIVQFFTEDGKCHFDLLSFLKISFIFLLSVSYFVSLSTRGPIFEKAYVTKLWRIYDHKYAIFERSCDDFMILSYYKVMITNFHS